MTNDVKLAGSNIVEISPDKINDSLERLQPSLAIIDATHISASDLQQYRDISSATNFVGICTCVLPPTIRNQFDALYSIYEPAESFYKIMRDALSGSSKQSDRQTELTQREKEIVIGIVKGLSNKELASDMHVSVNTVMTHRRNIASKLQIHSAAGLTIYAIVSKLVTLDDVKSSIN